MTFSNWTWSIIRNTHIYIYIFLSYHPTLNVFTNNEWADTRPCKIQGPQGLLRYMSFSSAQESLRWRHNGNDGVSNHQPHHCFLNRLFGCRSKKTSKLRVTGLCAGNSPGTGIFPARMASNAENVAIWWRHHVLNKMLVSLGILALELLSFDAQSNQQLL